MNENTNIKNMEFPVDKRKIFKDFQLNLSKEE